MALQNRPRELVTRSTHTLDNTTAAQTNTPPVAAREIARTRARRLMDRRRPAARGHNLRDRGTRKARKKRPRNELHDVFWRVCVLVSIMGALKLS